ncbi:MAG: cohesin domain-containing protein [Candidatus Dojkabacteria bacterium]|nr:cohesin domain-containing protein [Candidatus Dojkabacteria bacterium]
MKLEGAGFAFSEESAELQVGESMELLVTLENSSSTPVSSAELVLAYDPTAIQVDSITGVTEGFNFFIGDEIDSEKGLARISASSLSGDIEGDTAFATITITKIDNINSLIEVIGTQDLDNAYSLFILEDTSEAAPSNLGVIEIR